MTEDKTSPKSKSDTTRSIILNVVGSLIAVAIAGILSPVFPYLNETVKLPVWGYLTFVVVFFVIVIWTVVFFRQQLKREVADYEETITLWEKAQTDWNHTQEERDKEHNIETQEWFRAQTSWHGAEVLLKAELAQERQMVLFEGFYYQGSDTEHKNPMCRICWEGNARKTTVVKQWEGDYGRFYHCDICENDYQLPPASTVGTVWDPTASKEEFDGEDIPL